MNPLKERVDPRSIDPKECYWAKVKPGEEPDGMAAIEQGKEVVIIGSRPLYYPSDTHGTLTPINIDISEGQEPEGYTHRENRNTIKFCIRDNGAATYTHAGRSLSLQLTKRALADKATHEKKEKTMIARALSKKDNRKSKVEYIGDEFNVDHIVEPGRVKENIIIPVKPELDTALPYSVLYNYNSDDVYPVNVGEVIEWRTLDDDCVFSFPAPVAWDANGANIPCAYSIDNVAHTISVDVDAVALDSATFPVTVDPTITTGQSDIEACSGWSNAPFTSYPMITLQVGRPTLPAGTTLTDAEVQFTSDSASGTLATTAYCDGTDISGYTPGNANTKKNALWASSDDTDTASISGTGVKTWNIFGNAATNGAAYVYAQDTDAQLTAYVIADAVVGNSIAGEQSTPELRASSNSSVFLPASDSSDYPRIILTYTSVAGPPIADFTVDNTTPDAGEEINFTDLSDPNGAAITDWLWTFGDGDSSTAQDPAHTYMTADTFTVSLQVTNSEGSDTEPKTDYITTSLPPASTGKLSGNVALVKLYVSTDSGTSYNQILGLHSLAFPGATVDLYDATNTDVIDNFKKYLLGWEDGDETEFNHRYTETTYAQLDALPSTPLKWKLQWIDPAHTTADPYITWDGKITQRETIQMPIDDTTDITFTVKCESDPEFFQGL
jgi:PKD repeat protein